MSAFSNLQKHDSAREMLLAHTCSLHRGQSRREIYIILICSEEKKTQNGNEFARCSEFCCWNKPIQKRSGDHNMFSLWPAGPL